MQISTKDWAGFVSRLSRVSAKAADELRMWVNRRGGLLGVDRSELIDYVYALATKYGESTGALAAAWYDAVAEASGVYLPPAELAATASYNDAAKAVNGVLDMSRNEDMLTGAVERLVKLPGLDTTLRAAIRDGAAVAWIPNGDTCAFCIALAAAGWQKASRRMISRGHASHVHANCDCTYAVRFDDSTTVAGYDPKTYEDMYYGADLDHWNTPDGRPPAGNTSENDPLNQQRINAMRREIYAENRERINAQKRDAYQKRIELNSSAAEEADV